MPVFHEDNTAFIRICKTGRNTTMRHLDRVHRISIGSLHEKLSLPDVEIRYTPSHLMAADVYTKGFTNAPKWDAAISLIGVYTLSDRTQLKIKYRKCIDRSAVSALSAVTCDCVSAETIRPKMVWLTPAPQPAIAEDHRSLAWWRNASFEERAE